MDSVFHYPYEVKMLYLLLFGVFIVLAPGMSLLVLRMNKSISSLSLENREERGTPIAIMTFYCLVLFLFLIFQENRAMVPNIIKGMALGGFLASALSYLMNRSFKVSLHGVGMGALAGFVLMYFVGMEIYSLPVLLLIFILGGIVLSTRLFLNAHNLKEVAIGYGLGFVSQIVCIYFYNLIS
jgi:membrane-associated phospholipid phosphatase